jgi:V/A-type H+-transporting ATPase subunit E
MSKAFENVISKVVGEARQEVKAIFEDSLRLSLEILEANKRGTLVEVEKIRGSMERRAETLRLRILGSTELVIRSKSLELVEQMMNEIFQKAFEKVEKITSSDRYKTSIRRLLEEGVEIVSSKDLVVLCNKRDFRILKVVVEEVAKERGLNIKVAEEPIESIGGVQVRSSDGNIFYDNTIEARMERLKPLLKKEIASLFMYKE